MRYKAKVVEVEATQFKGVTVHGIEHAVAFDDWIDAMASKCGCTCSYHGQEFIIRDGLGHKQVALPGDYIVRDDVNHCLVVMREDYFLARYQPI